MASHVICINDPSDNRPGASLPFAAGVAVVAIGLTILSWHASTVSLHTNTMQQSHTSVIPSNGPVLSRPLAMPIAWQHTAPFRSPRHSTTHAAQVNGLVDDTPTSTGMMNWLTAALLVPFAGLGLLKFWKRSHEEELWAMFAASSATDRKPWTRSNRDPSWKSKAPNELALAKQVEELLIKRDEFRTNKDYANADAIEVQLREMNVLKDDATRTWRAVNRNSKQPDSPWKRSQDDTSAKPGTPEDAELEQKVLALCVKRDELRTKGDYAEADKIRTELSRMGVYLDTKKRTWTRTPPQWLPARPPTPELKAKVDELLLKRDLARQNQDLVTADAIRDELRNMNIKLNQKRRMWLDTTVPWEEYSPQNSRASPELVAEVLAAIQRRAEHVEKKEYDQADAIQAELLAKGVQVDDLRKRWSTVPAKAAAEQSSGSEK